MQMNRPTLSLLVAAKKAELGSLQQLLKICALVSQISELVHQLQRERGISNVYMSSAGALFASERAAQLTATAVAEQALLQTVQQQQLDQIGMFHHSRLLVALAQALQGMESLSGLRALVEQPRADSEPVMRQYSQLIHHWLSVVLESADLASNATVSKPIVALLHLLQAKEFAGQERAIGVLMFAGGPVCAEHAERLLLLQQAQQQSLDTVWLMLGPEVSAPLQQQLDACSADDFAALRTFAAKLAQSQTDAPALSDVWYQAATRRVDQLQQFLLWLRQQLEQLAAQEVDNTRQLFYALQQALQQHKHAAVSPLPLAPLAPAGTALLRADAGAEISPDGMADPRQTTLLRLLREQSQYICQVETRLAEARNVIAEQKLIHRAKLLLVQQCQFSEADAHRKLQKLAMTAQVPLVLMAQKIVGAAGG